MAKTLEQSFERLEEIIAQMEKSDTTLDASFKMYQEGMKLVDMGCGAPLESTLLGSHPSSPTRYRPC